MLRLRDIGYASRRRWESLLGSLNFAAQLIPEYRHHYFLIAKPQLLGPAHKRDQRHPIPKTLLTGLETWISLAPLTKTAPFQREASALTIWTDASPEGWGLQTSKNFNHGALWDQEESLLHINRLEVRAVVKSLEFLEVHDMTIRLMTDNECARSVIKKMGSKSTDLQQEASVLFHLCNSRRLLLDAHRIPSHLNVCADALSRKDPRPAEWGLPQETFQKITDWHGPLQVDLMASPHNNKLPLYVSAFEYPGAVATDVLAVDWNQWQEVYIFPPPNFIPQLLPKLQDYKHHGVILSPHRPSAGWYPVLLKRAQKQLLLQTRLHQKTAVGLVSSEVCGKWIAWSF
jgi:hypothetical protein